MSSPIKKILLLSVGVTALLVGISFAYVQDNRTKNTSLSTNILHSDKQANASESLPQNHLVGTPSAEGATLEFAKKIAEDLIKKNPKGPSIANGEQFINGINPDTLVEQLLKDSSLDIGSFAPTITLADLIIDNDVSQKAIKTYFSKLDILFQSTRKSLLAVKTTDPLAQFYTSGEILGTLVTSLKNLSVPQVLQNLHKKQIEIIATEQNIFFAIGNAKTDPVTGITAFHLFPDVLEKVQFFEIELIATKNKYGIE